MPSFKWVKWYHILFALFYLAGAALFSFVGFFVAWPIIDHFKTSPGSCYAFIPSLIGILIWSAMCLRLYLKER